MMGITNLVKLHYLNRKRKLLFLYNKIISSLIHINSLFTIKLLIIYPVSQPIKYPQDSTGIPKLPYGITFHNLLLSFFFWLKTG